MTPVAIVTEVNLLFSGLLAGAEVAIHYGLGRSDAVLNDQSQIRHRQAMILRLRILMPVLFLPAAATGVLLLSLDSVSPGLRLRYAGLIAVAVWIVLRVVATVRINSTTLTWKPEDPPENWKALVTRVERFHVLGVWAAIMLFLCFLTAAMIAP
jgi:hypothetical protein